MIQRRIRTLCCTALAAAITCSTAAQAASGDCPPFGRMPKYVAKAEPQLRNYDAVEFRIAKSDGAEETVMVAGRACRQDYSIKDGAEPASNLEIQENYLSQVQKFGAQKLFSDDRNLYARFTQGGKEIWLALYSQESDITLTVIERQPFKPTLLPPSGSDHRLFGHMPNYNGQAQKRNFDKFTFNVQNGDETKEIEVRGARHSVAYNIAEGATMASIYDAHENYRHVVETLGGQVLHRQDRSMSARLENNGQTIWLNVYSQESDIQLEIIEEKAFQASITAPEASAMKTALDKDGRISLYVNFDFNKATLKADAAPVVGQIVKLLKDNPGLKIEIGGHTDNIGGRDYNLKLSAQRASAIVAALVAQGVAADRLRAAGYGPEKPIADNDKEEGRAKNRRVELVKG
ncbi:outer membrane protein OmpA-like peptidoglycan-associated protein [Bradyrhizobium sp. AZCC 1588]|uniref:OmpA family protein n=1 Tax=unclassified Bradyrhizobium TaxID=2631580 RepID=UPI002FEFD457